MGGNKAILIFILLSAFILTLGVFLLSKSGTQATLAPSYNTKAQADQKTYDWGIINMKDGNVNKTFIIKNTGADVLKLTKVKTSCHCTKASVIINGVASPIFGMNTNFSWIGEVLPNSEAQLSIVFDPAYHGPNGVGPITRYVSVDTNDPKTSTLEFTLTANVTR